MAKAKNLPEPVRDTRIELVEFTGEEVIDPFYDNQMIFSRQRGNERPDLLDCAEFVVGAMNEKLWFAALEQKRKINAIDGNSQTD